MRTLSSLSLTLKARGKTRKKAESKSPPKNKTANNKTPGRPTWHGRAMWHGQTVPHGTVVPTGTARPCHMARSCQQARPGRATLLVSLACPVVGARTCASTPVHAFPRLCVSPCLFDAFGFLEPLFFFSIFPKCYFACETRRFSLKAQKIHNMSKIA